MLEINNNKQEEIRKILNSYNEKSEDTLGKKVEKEIEIRFGLFTSNRPFSAGIVSRQIFNSILDNFNKIFKKIADEKSSNIVTKTYEITRYKNGVRSISEQGGSCIVQKKKRIGIVDFENLNIRLALSEEQHGIEDLPDKDDEYEMKFTRKRTSFFDRKNNIRLDLSENTNATKRMIPFEFEVEFLDKELSINKVNWVIKTFHNIYKKHNTIFNVIRGFNYLFPKDEVRNKNKLYIDNKSKPVNIKVYNLPFLEDYVFSPKPNGVSYFLYFHQTNIYLVNDTRVLLYTNYTNENLEFKGTIILGELMSKSISAGEARSESISTSGFVRQRRTHWRGQSPRKARSESIFYCYDTLFYKSQDVRSISAIERNRIINNILGKVKNIRKLPMFFSGRETRESINNVNNYISKYFPKHEDNDGIILKHNYSPYNFDKNIHDNIVYKWKPIEHITIDFLVKCDMEYKDNPTACGRYKIYMGGPKRIEKGKEVPTLELFTGTRSHPYSGYVDVSLKEFGLISDGTILEFYYCIKTKKLVPQRIRTDKFIPNYRTTALSTWEDIFYPITMDVLKESSDIILSKKLTLVENSNNICSFIRKFVNFPNSDKIFDKLDNYLSTNVLTKLYKTLLSYLYVLDKNKHIKLDKTQLDILRSMDNIIDKEIFDSQGSIEIQL